MATFNYIFIFFCLIPYSSQVSRPEDETYVAAVLEYVYVGNTATNLLNFLRYIEEAAQQNADIVVFPELTLNMRDPVTVPFHGSLQEHPVPALEPDMYHDVLVQISNAARQHQIYVVINVEERLNCTQPSQELCPEERVYLFNTNVVFDRNGAVIDRYRKINLFGEFTRTPALNPDLGIFETDFGVTFGHYICFDLKFRVPALQIVQKMNITNLIYPTMWYSELPYLTAVQIQEAYAFEMNVNLLASGANNVRFGSAGSGIFSGRAGALTSVMPGLPTSRLLVSRVPKVPGRVTFTIPGPIYNEPVDHDSLSLLRDPSLDSHVTRTLVPGLQEFVLRDHDITCTFRVDLNENERTRYKYRAGAFSGVRTYSGLASGGVRTCSVFACTGDTIDSCGRRFAEYAAGTTATFDELNIIASVATPVLDLETEASDAVYFPVSLDSSIMPLEPDKYTYSEDRNGNLTTYSIFLDKTDMELYSFAVWGRVFETDGQDPDPPRDETTDDPVELPGAVTVSIENVSESTPSVTTGNPGGFSVVHVLTKSLLIPTILLLLK